VCGHDQQFPLIAGGNSELGCCMERIALLAANFHHLTAEPGPHTSVRLCSSLERALLLCIPSLCVTATFQLAAFRMHHRQRKHVDAMYPVRIERL
jgi:hypothetical protein